MKTSVYIATSLDGFIARENGDLDWLPGSDVSDEVEGEDYGYREFMASVDVIVMGRHTFEKVLSFGRWPYRDKPVVVLRHKSVNIPNNLINTVSAHSGSPIELVNMLRSKGANHSYIDGGKTIQSFLRDGLIDELTITRIPILIGQGIPLFGPLQADIKLQHIETRTYSNGLVQSRYGVCC